MPTFGAESRSHLAEIDPRLQRVLTKVVEAWDCKIIDGRRTVEEQRKNVARGVSKTMDSKHLGGFAVDVMPWPLDWNKIQLGLNAIHRATGGMEVAEAYAFAGFVDGVAWAMGYNLRSGYDWNTNRQFEDQTFLDLPHHELRG